MSRSRWFLVLVGCVVAATRTASAQTPAEHRFILTANAGVQALSVTRTDSTEFELYAETGTLETTQTIGPDPVFDGGVSVRLSRRIGLGVMVSHVQGQTDGRIDALVPHPFFFDFRREAQGTADGLEHRELGVHLQGQYWMPVTRSLLVTVSGGFSYFDATQDLVSDITASEVGFPYDEVDIVSHTTTRVSTDALGYNVGVDVAYFFHDRIGLGVTARFSRATSGFELEGVRQPPLELGGLHAIGGVRVGF